MKKKLIGWALVALAALSSTACVGRLEKYEFAHPVYPHTDWTALSGDADMTLDGRFEEEQYGRAQELSLSAQAADTGLNVRTYLGETGAYFAVRAFLPARADNEPGGQARMEDGRRESNWAELYIAPAGHVMLSRDCVQLRMGADGRTAQWVGTPSDADGYAWTRALVPCSVSVARRGATAGDAGGFDAEVYLPYTSVGLTEKPASLLVLPALQYSDNGENYRATLAGGAAERPVTYALAGDQAPRVTADGRFADWPEEAGETVRLCTGEDGRGYSYMAYRDERGLYIACDATHETFVADREAWYDNTHAEFYLNGERMWTTAGAQSHAALHSYWTTVENDGVYRTRAEIFVPDGLLADTVTFGFSFGTAGETAVGNSRNVADAPFVVTQKGIAEYVRPAPSVTVDGDLADWTDAAVRRNKATVRAEDGPQGFDVYAFSDKNGLHIAYDVRHSTYLTGQKEVWDDNHAEVFIQDRRLWATADGAADGVTAAMRTEQQDDGAYRTVVEMFVPAGTFVRDESTLTALAGFAFQTTGDRISVADAARRADKGIKNDDWWFPTGHAPHEIGQQYYVNGTGIHEYDPR